MGGVALVCFIACLVSWWIT